MAPTPDRRILKDVVAHVRDENPGLCRKWFSELECAGVFAGTLYIRAASDLHRRYLQAECVEVFQSAAMQAVGHLVSVEFLAPEDPVPAASHNGSVNIAREPAPIVPPLDGHVGVALNPDLTFDTFVDSPSSELAYAAAQAVGARTARRYSPLFIHGATGLGKTHLLHAICHERLRQDPASRILFLHCREFIDRFMDALRQQALDRLRAAYRSVDLLLIDDVHSLSQMGQSQEEFFNTFNTLHEAGREIVVTADSAPDQIPDLEARLVSRFTGGLKVEVLPPLYEARVRIVRDEAARRGVDLPDEAAALIAARNTQNVRQLFGDLSAIMNRASKDGPNTPITLELARETLGVAQNDVPGLRTTIPDILQAVADFYNVSVAEIQSPRRTRSITRPRHVGVYLCRRLLPQHSLQEIGGYVGGRDHSTVLYACRIIEDGRTRDSELDADLTALERSIRRRS